MKRREFISLGLKGAVAAAGVAGLVGGHPFMALGQQVSGTLDENDPNAFVFSRFRYVTLNRVDCEWDALPTGDENALQFIREQTNIRVSNKPWAERVIGIDEFDKMRKNPFLFMTGEGNFIMTQPEADALAEFFRRGGFLYADDCVCACGNEDQFYQAFVREIQKVMPGYKMEPVPPAHEIYHCHFDFPEGKSPHCQGRMNPDMGLFYEGKMVAFLTSGDVHCGWVGSWFNEAVQVQCRKLAVNIVVYALTH